MDVVAAGDLCPPFFSPLRSLSAPSRGHDSLIQCAAEMVDSPTAFGLACRRGEMDTHGARTRDVAVATARRTCPETCRLSIPHPDIPKTLPPKQRARSTPARSQSLSDTRWTSATPTTARKAADGHQP